MSFWLLLGLCAVGSAFSLVAATTRNCFSPIAGPNTLEFRNVSQQLTRRGQHTARQRERERDIYIYPVYLRLLCLFRSESGDTCSCSWHVSWRAYSCLVRYRRFYGSSLKGNLCSFLTPLSPQNNCGWALKPRGLDRPLCPGERERERYLWLCGRRERYRSSNELLAPPKNPVTDGGPIGRNSDPPPVFR